MTTPKHAAPRHRAGRPHLSLVTQDDAADPPTADEQPTTEAARHAAQNRRLLASGNATVRALIALGALAAALGLTDAAKSMAATLDGHHTTTPVAEGDTPPTQNTPATPPAPHTTPAPAPAHQWTPRPRTVPVSYTASAPTGRHRKPPATAHHPRPWADEGTGRHRATPPGHTPEPAPQDPGTPTPQDPTGPQQDQPAEIKVSVPVLGLTLAAGL